MDKLTIFLTEVKLALESKKEDFLYEWDNVVFFFASVEDEIKRIYNKYCKSKVEKTKLYFKNLFRDLDDSLSFLDECIWYQFDGRIAGYLSCVIMAFFLFVLLGIFNLLGLPAVTLLISFIPITLIPIDIIVTASLFISKRFKRMYNNSFNRMKKEYGVRNSRDLIDAYKAKKEKEEELKVEKKQARKVIRVKTKENVPNTNTSLLTDSDFLENMFAFVNATQNIPESDRKVFLDEINLILDKYSYYKKVQGGNVNGLLTQDFEHLQSEYNRYLSENQSEDESLGLYL